LAGVLKGVQPGVEAVEHTSLSGRSCDENLPELGSGKRSVIENAEDPSKASRPHVTKLCHAPAVAIRRREGIGCVARDWDMATKNVGKTR
jgi:hypothetical protein